LKSFFEEELNKITENVNSSSAVSIT
jgi:hypothetical protein